MSPRTLLLLAALGGLAAAATARADSLYDGLGQKAGIDRIVAGAVTLFLADSRVKDDFDNINLDRLRARLADYLCQVVDGPCEYKGRAMDATHAGLHLDRAKFNAVAEDLQTAMEQAGIPYWTQNRVIARLAPKQREIVTR